MQFRLTGISPLIHHDNKTANPLHPLKKLQAQLTSKRKKTDEDHTEIARIDWLAALYYDKSVGVYVPGQNVERMIVDAARHQRLGNAVKQGVVILDLMLPLTYSGPADPEALFADTRFVDIRAVRNQQVRVMRCRPIFREWQLDFTVEVDPDILDEKVVEEIVHIAGKRTGLCDYRPRFGRFTAERIA